MNLKIMFEYMIEMDLPIPFDDEFLSLIPRQRAMVNRLMNKGIITSYAVSLDSGRFWMMMLAESEQNADSVVSEFPIYRHVTYKINKLTFHNSIGLAIPQFSAN
jgi:Muconolactone delta-isomerase